MTSTEWKRAILAALSSLVEHTPGIRSGQLIANLSIINLSIIARGPTPERVWDMEDDEWLDAIKSHIEDYEHRHAGAA
jgi:hypothetical protein